MSALARTGTRWLFIGHCLWCARAATRAAHTSDHWIRKSQPGSREARKLREVGPALRLRRRPAQSVAEVPQLPSNDSRASLIAHGRGGAVHKVLPAELGSRHECTVDGGRGALRNRLREWPRDRLERQV